MSVSSTRLATSLVLLCVGPMAAQGAATDAPRLPSYRGRVERFTLAPGGIIDGLLLTDGMEVKTPPHLSAQMGAAIAPGDPVTVFGLKAASLSLVQAVVVADERTGRTVVDHGLSAPPEPARPAGSAPAHREGTIRLLLHGPRGEVNALLLDDGTTIRTDALGPLQVSPVYHPGSFVVAEGDACDTPYGTVIRATAIGARTAGAPGRSP